MRAEISEIKAKQLLKEQDSTKRFAVQVAHDLGTPLQGLRLAFNLASTQHKVGSDFQENVSIMHTCINSLTQLREMMMDEAKSVNRERGRSVNRCDPVVSVCCNVRITQGFRFSCTPTTILLLKYTFSSTLTILSSSSFDQTSTRPKAFAESRHDRPRQLTSGCADHDGRQGDCERSHSGV